MFLCLTLTQLPLCIKSIKPCDCHGGRFDTQQPSFSCCWGATVTLALLQDSKWEPSSCDWMCWLKHSKAVVSCLISVWPVALDLIQAARSCEYHEYQLYFAFWPTLEKDLEEITQVLKLPRSRPIPLVDLFSTSFLPCFWPSLSHIYSPPPSHSFHLSPCFSSLLFCPPPIPLPLFMTFASSLPGDLQWRKEASPFPLLLNTCSYYNLWEAHTGFVTIHTLL